MYIVYVNPWEKTHKLCAGKVLVECNTVKLNVKFSFSIPLHFNKYLDYQHTCILLYNLYLQYMHTMLSGNVSSSSTHSLSILRFEMIQDQDKVFKTKTSISILVLRLRLVSTTTMILSCFCTVSHDCSPSSCLDNLRPQNA